MRPQYIMGLAFIWVMCTLFGLMMGGVWFGTHDASMMNWLTGYSSWEAAGMFAVITVPIGFFLHGLPALILFDYPFFAGELSIIRWILIAVFASATVFVVASTFGYSFTSMFGRR